MADFYKPFIMKLENSDNNFKDTISFSNNKNISLISSSYHYFYRRTLESLSITNNFDKANELYYVVNPFEINILNYEDSLTKLTKTYLNIDVLDREFYIIWELLFLFELIDTSEELSCTILSSTFNIIIQALESYRKKYNIHSTKDKYFTISDKELENKILSKFEKTYSNLIIANLGYDDEPNIYHIILNEIITTLKIQDINGHFVLKIFGTVTHQTLKLLFIMSSFYSETYIYKPYYSRLSLSEKYVMFKHFKYDQKKDSSFLNEKIKLLENIINAYFNLPNKKYIFDIFTELKLPNEYIKNFIFINMKLMNSQQIIINDIIKYIKEDNNFGDKYHSYRNIQIDTTKWWVNSFFPPSNNLYKKNKEDLIKQLNIYKDSYMNECIKFISTIKTIKN